MQAKRNKEIQGVKIGKQGQTFTHLLFVDDSLWFFQNDQYIVPNIQKIVSWYLTLQGNALTSSNLIYIAPLTCLRRIKMF